jgi:hypothetical protein
MGAAGITEIELRSENRFAVMTPIDFRNETWGTVQARIVGLRLEVWLAWQRFGPGTTREVAARRGLDILMFRPRTTELFQLGFVELDPVQPKRGEGVYRAVHPEVALLRFEEKKRRPQQSELQLR